MADIFIDWVVSAKGYDRFLLISNMTVSPSHSPNIPPALTRVSFHLAHSKERGSLISANVSVISFVPHFKSTSLRKRPWKNASHVGY